MPLVPGRYYHLLSLVSRIVRRSRLPLLLFTCRPERPCHHLSHFHRCLRKRRSVFIHPARRVLAPGPNPLSLTRTHTHMSPRRGKQLTRLQPPPLLSPRHHLRLRLRPREPRPKLPQPPQQFRTANGSERFVKLISRPPRRQSRSNGQNSMLFCGSRGCKQGEGQACNGQRYGESQNDGAGRHGAPLLMSCNCQNCRIFVRTSRRYD